jgi:hypothetical protein
VQHEEEGLMAWFKIDDGFAAHRKVLALRRGNERLRAIGLWTLAGSLSAKHGLGGKVPDYLLEELGATDKDVEALIRVGLWKRADDTEFHDWSVYNPDAATLEAQRLKESVSGSLGNHRRWHVRRNLTVPDCEHCHRVPDREPDWDPDRGSVGSGIGSASPVPVPDKDLGANAPSFTSAVAAVAPIRGDVERICEHLADRIEANGAKRPTITQKWRDAARLMLDRDGRTEAEVIGAIDWSQADEFWRANVLSLPKLREKYDQLLLQAQRRHGVPRQQQTDDLFDRAARRMGVIQ